MLQRAPRLVLAVRAGVAFGLEPRKDLGDSGDMAKSTTIECHEKASC